MDVTCERCSTAYEFDDALVSERGTTVKCTSCGHQFKVRRPQPAGAPERWLVRTIDGRELEFRALRELQAAIAQALITRDDVLSRGGSRPRRLGNIAELEPFFASVAGGAQHPTNLGLGPGGKPPPRGRAPLASTPIPPGTASRPEVSVAIPLPGGSRDPGHAAQAAAAREQASVDEETQVMSHHQAAMFPPRRPSRPPPPPRPSRPPPPPAGMLPGGLPGVGLPGVVVGPLGAPPPPVIIHEDATVQGSYGDATVEGSYDDATVGHIYDETTRSLNVEARAAAAELAREGAAVPQRGDLGAPTVPFAIGPILDAVTVRALAQDDWGQPAAEPPASLELAAAEDRLSLPSVPSGQGGEPVSGAPTSSPVSAPSSSPVSGDVASGSLLTPTPAPIRVSSYGGDEAYGEPRFSIAGAPRRAGAARWIVGFIVAGLVVFAFATVGRKMLAGNPTAAGGEADARVGGLLTEGEKSLADGDLEQAKEQFDKASVLAERDARVVADLARLAAAKADVEWLRVRLLVADDPEQAGARRELEQAVQRARRAADRAAEIAPADPGVARSRIDALRLAGDLEGARKLVAAIAGLSAQPDNARILASLDLAEARPDWGTVIARLRTAVGGDGNLGRARALLVYALARSGDLPGARSELERLKAVARPHPLVGALTGYIARADKAVDVSSLPDASGKPRADRPAPSATPVASASPPPPPAAREPAPTREPPRERPAPEPRPVTPDPPVSPPGGAIDTSDLPGVKTPVQPVQPAQPPPTSAPAPAPPPTNNTPPGVDTSDLPGFK
jgi:predicted Zn finger-like uncharacterized protein